MTWIDRSESVRACVSHVNSVFPLAGKLGHGDTNRVYKPKVVEALQGMFIRKVCAGSQSSLALTSTGQVGQHYCS